MGRKFIAAGIDNAPTTDFNPFNADQVLAGPSPFYSQTAGTAIGRSALMRYIWSAARNEWKERFP